MESRLMKDLTPDEISLVEAMVEADAIPSMQRYFEGVVKLCRCIQARSWRYACCTATYKCVCNAAWLTKLVVRVKLTV
jgi:hypothetical protein